MALDPRLLRQAQALSTHRSFTLAARALGISQSTLSRGIRDLEEDLGVTLILRSRRGVEPTDFGWHFLERSTTLLRELEDLEQEARQVRGMKRGEMSVGMGPYAASMLAPPAASRFSSEYPTVQLRIHLGAWDLQLRWLRAREIHLAVGEGSVIREEEDLARVAPLAPLAGFVVARAGHPATRRTGLQMRDLLAYPFVLVMRLPPRLLRRLLVAPQGVAGTPGTAPPFPTIEIPTVELGIRIVARSDAVMMTTLGAVRDELERGAIVPLLSEPWLHTDWTIVRLARRGLSPAAAAFADELARAHVALEREEAELAARWREDAAGAREGVSPSAAAESRSGR